MPIINSTMPFLTARKHRLLGHMCGGKSDYVRAEPKKAPATPASALLLFNFKIGVKHAILYDEIRQNQFNAPHFCPFTDLY